MTTYERKQKLIAGIKRQLDTLANTMDETTNKQVCYTEIEVFEDIEQRLVGVIETANLIAD